MTCTASKVIEVAQREVGYLEKATNSQLDEMTANAGSKNYTKYARDLDALGNFYNGQKNGYPWCDVFVDWCFVQAFGVKAAKTLLCQPDNSSGAGSTSSAKYYKNNNRLHEGKSIPKPGDQIFFQDSVGGIVHTGLVWKVDTTDVYTIEGNTSSKTGVIPNGGCVASKKYSLMSSNIYGYGRPAYVDVPYDESAGSGFVLSDPALLSTDKGKIWTFLTSKFNSCAAAGIMGNIECESNFKPNNMQDSYATEYNTTDEKYTKEVDDGTYRYGSYTDARSSFAHDSAGYGLIQWTYYSLKESLYDNAKDRNVSIADMDLQCDELYHVMDTKMLYSQDVYPDGYDATNWTKATNLIDELTSDAFIKLSEENEYAAVKYATALFLFECERCSDYQNKIDLRFERSKPIYDTFKGLGCSHDQTRMRGTVIATCDKEGYTGDKICVACGVQVEKGEKIPATGHLWDYEYGGQVCSVCSYVERYPIGGATPDAAKMKRVHNVLRDILLRKNDTVITEE